MEGYYNRIKKIKDYLYEIWYTDIDYDNAYEYYKSKEDPINGGCSSIRNGNFLFRNFDWYYDNGAEFIVHVSHGKHRYSSVGIVGGIKELTNEFVESKEESNLYKILPFNLLDFVNEKGVSGSMNVVPIDKGKNKTVPTESLEVELNASMVLRYIADKFSTAIDAVNYLRKHSSIYFSQDIHNSHYEVHYLIADQNDTFVVELINNEVVILENKYYMTNFYLNGVTFNDDGKVYTPSTQTDNENAYDTNKITLEGAGLERWNIIVDNYSSANTKEGARALLNKLKYTNAYTNIENIWYTEFVGNGFTVKTSASDYDVIIPIVKQAYDDRTRNTPVGSIPTWQTVHSVIYDLNKKQLYIIVQEDEEELVYMEGSVMYKIMEVKKKGSNNFDSLYAFKTQTVDGVVQPIEIETDAALDEYVEDLLNNKGYAKSDFIVITEKDYTIDTDID